MTSEAQSGAPCPHHRSADIPVGSLPWAVLPSVRSAAVPSRSTSARVQASEHLGRLASAVLLRLGTAIGVKLSIGVPSVLAHRK